MMVCAGTANAQGPPVPGCSANTDACTTDADCVRSDLVCMAVGPPGNPGLKNCICKDSYYGNPQEMCQSKFGVTVESFARMFVCLFIFIINEVKEANMQPANRKFIKYKCLPG